MHRLVKSLYKIYDFPLRTHSLTTFLGDFSLMNTESQGVTQRLQFRGRDSNLASSDCHLMHGHGSHLAAEL